MDADPEKRLVDLVHDLRTPLAVVLGFSELLVKRYDRLDEETRREFAGRIDEAAQELRQILDDERDERLAREERGG